LGKFWQQIGIRFYCNTNHLFGLAMPTMQWELWEFHSTLWKSWRWAKVDPEPQWEALSVFFAGLGFVGLLSATDMLGAGHEYELALIFIAPISVATGTVLGAIIGRSEKWEEVPLVRLGIMPQGPNRAMLSASFRF
jgi:hypothetical protein